MPEGARILKGDTRPWESPTILCGCLKPRYLGRLGRMSLFPFRSALVLSYQKTLPEFLSVLPVRYNRFRGHLCNIGSHILKACVQPVKENLKLFLPRVMSWQKHMTACYSEGFSMFEGICQIF
jgi:hypothetical protein